MYQARTKKQELRRRLLTYTIMPVAIGVGVALLVMYIIGYRYNAADRTVDQGGLIQFVTQPTGAKVEVDGTSLRRTTNTRLDASSGAHTVTISKAGYRPWQKTITVEPGTVHWLNYVRLLPEEIATKRMLKFDTVAQAVSVRQQDRLLVLKRASKPVVTVVDLTSSGASSVDVALPAKLHDSDSKASYAVDSVDRTGRYAILKNSAKQTQWFVLDLESPGRSIDVSSIATSQVSDVQFFAGDARKLYAVASNALRQIDLDERTISAPLVAGVDAISQSAKGVIAYVSTKDNTSSQRTVGYYTAGASKPRVLRRIYDNGTQPVNFQIGEYRDERYGAVRIGNNLEILGLESEPSDASDEPPRTKNISTVTLPEGSDYLSFSPGGRFIVSQKSSTFLTYDLELMKVTTTSLKGDASVNRQLQWLDKYHIWSDRGGVLNLYEFDGANAHKIGSVAANHAVLLSDNGKKLWYLTSDDSSFAITEASLIN